MAKKTAYKFSAHLTLNPDKGGAWLGIITLTDENGVTHAFFTSAWKNASAAKRYIKAVVQELTPRKSVKMVAGENLDVKGKPVSFTGELTYKI